MPSVRFVRMWSGFNPRDNPLLPVLQQSLKEEIEVRQNPRSNVDIEVASVYPPRRTGYGNMVKVVWDKATRSSVDPRAKFLDPPKSSNAKLGIWYTPDNIRPPESGWDITLSFEPTGWTTGNVYLPFWQLGTDLFGGNHGGFLGRTLTIQELIRSRPSAAATRERFCCAFIRNPHPVRMRAIQALRAVGQVDVFGVVGNQPIGDKLEVARQYRFVLCFENDLYPGYITEKIFDAWASGAVPLWWGMERHQYLNPGAYINLNSFHAMQDFVDEVDRLNRDAIRLESIAGQPLLLAPPSTGPILQLLRSAWTCAQR